MQNSDPWSDLMEEFRCLWDPQDPSFGDETQRELAFEQLHYMYNRRHSLNFPRYFPVDLVTLKLWMATFQKRKTGRQAMDACYRECITKSEDIAPLLPEFPCLWDSHDLNFLDKTVTDHCLKQMLKKYNGNRSQIISMETLVFKVNMFHVNMVDCRERLSYDDSNENVSLSSDRQRRNESVSASYERRPPNINVSPSNERQPTKENVSASNERLWRNENGSAPNERWRHNEIGSAPDERWRHNEIGSAPDERWRHNEIGSAPNERWRHNKNVSAPNKQYQNNDSSAPNKRCRNNDNVSAPNKRCRNNDNVSARNELCRNNDNVSAPNERWRHNEIGSAPNDRQLRVENDKSSSNREQSHKDASAPDEGWRRNENVSASNERQWRNEYVSASSDQLRHNENLSVSGVRQRRDKDVSLSNEQQRRNEAVSAPNERLPPNENVAASNKRRPPNENVAASNKRPPPNENVEASNERLAALLKHYPCLWDPQDPNFCDNELKARLTEQLLEKYNAGTSDPITMHRLKGKMRLLVHQCRMSQESTERLAELLKDYPCLWDPQDLNFRDRKLRRAARGHLRHRYNAVSRIPIDMDGLRSKLQLLKTHRRKTQESTKRFANLVKEFPCLSDPQDRYFQDRNMKARACEQLLRKYNTIYRTPMHMEELKSKLESLNQNRSLQQHQSTNALGVTTTNLLHSDDSQYSQANSHSIGTSIDEVPQEHTDEHSQHSDYDMDSDIEYENNYKDMKAVPISVTDTEFLKRSINVCVKETNEGKRRVYVDLNGCLSLPHKDYDRNNATEINRSIDTLPETEMYLASKKARIDSGIDFAYLHSSSSSSRDNNSRNDNAINCSPDSVETEFDLATKDRNHIISNEKAEIYSGIPVYETQCEVGGTEAIHSEVDRTPVSDTKRTGTFSEFSGEMWYSVELPNIFR